MQILWYYCVCLVKKWRQLDKGFWLRLLAPEIIAYITSVNVMYSTVEYWPVNKQCTLKLCPLLQQYYIPDCKICYMMQSIGCNSYISFTQMHKCCVFRPANTCLCIRSHGQKWLKTFENHEKSTFFIMHTRGSCNAHEEKWRKKVFLFFFTCGPSWTQVCSHE